jgi:hypothetical protein
LAVQKACAKGKAWRHLAIKAQELHAIDQILLAQVKHGQEPSE